MREKNNYLSSLQEILDEEEKGTYHSSHTDEDREALLQSALRSIEAWQRHTGACEQGWQALAKGESSAEDI